MDASVTRVAEAFAIFADTIVRAILRAEHLLSTSLALVSWFTIALAISALAMVVADLARLGTRACGGCHAVLASVARVAVAETVVAMPMEGAVVGAFQVQ